MLSPRYVDSREAPERRVPLERAGFQPKRLLAGDVQFPEAGGGVVLIETKKVGQFLQDMADGQLVRQCQRMREESDYCLLLLEGAFQVVQGQLVGTPYTWNHAWDQLLSCQELGVMLERTTDAGHTVERMLHLAERYSKDTHSAQQTSRHPSGVLGVTVLCAIYGVGNVTARQLLRTFGSLERIAVLSSADLEEVDGIGPKTAQRIRTFFATDWRPLPPEKMKLLP